MAFIRSSKVRHCFGQPAKKDFCYENIRPSKCASDGNFVAANGKLLAFCVDAGGGGVFCVIPISKTGRLDVDTHKVNAHRQYVVDLKWNPFDDLMLASCAEDGSIRVWQFKSEKGLTKSLEEGDAVLSFTYHQKKCVLVQWHPIASNILLSVSNKPDIVVWNLDDGEVAVKMDLPSIIFAAEWSSKGDKIVSSSKDKKFRIFDARNGTKLTEFDGHESMKPQRIVFTFDDTMMFSTGFAQSSERQFSIWNFDRSTNKVELLDSVELDVANGVLQPTYDPDTNMMYLIGRGDCVIRYYEIQKDEPYYHYINTYQSKEQQRAIASIPKRCVDVNTCEVMKFYKLIPGAANKPGSIKPVSFTIPRKSEIFQDDLYPDAISDEPGCDADDWFDANDVTVFKPKLVKMQTFFKGSLTASGSATGGGLKKGGLKGLKAKKASTAKPAEAAPAKASTPELKAAEPTKHSAAPSRSSGSPASTAASSSADNKVVKELQDEIKTLKDNEKKMQQEMKALMDKLKNLDKLTADLKVTCDSVKKNDSRLVALESLVQEEDDEE